MQQPRFSQSRSTDWQRFTLSILCFHGRVEGRGLGYWLGYEYLYWLVGQVDYRRAIRTDFWSGFVQFLADEVTANHISEEELAERFRRPL